MKKILVLCLALIMALTMIPMTALAEEPINIGVSLDNLDDPFWIGIKVGIDAAAVELAGKANIDIQIAQGDANTQNKQIQDMITAGADAIACVYVDQEAIKQSIKLANENGIPFVLIDRTLDSADDVKVDWCISTDNYALTLNGWEWMVQYAKDNGIQLKVLQLVGSLTDENVLRRSAGLDDIIAKYPETVELVQSVPTEWNAEKALAGVTNALQADPDINCIFMHSDALMAATIQALEAADRYLPIGEEGHVIVMPYSGNSVSLQAMSEGMVEMCFGMDVWTEGYKGIMAAYNLVMGNTEGYEEFVSDAGFIMTQENFAETSQRAYGAF